MRLLVAAGIVVMLGLTSGWWLTGIPTFFGFLEANSELIGALADSAQIVTSVMLVAGAILGYLGFKSLQGASAGEGAQQAVDVASGGRGAAVGGDVNPGAAVVVGDHNRVEVSRDVIYNYADVAPSPVDEGTLEQARRQFEALPVDEVPGRVTLPSGSVMPLRPNRHFVGRKQQLKGIAENFKAGDATVTSEVPVVAISGLGGVGKTQLASEFVHRYGQYFYGVYWVSFAEPGSVPAAIASCGGSGSMNLRPDFHALPLEERVQAVMAEWQSELPRLLVFDNCEDENLLDQWLPPVGGCRVLVTSRRSNWDTGLGVSPLPLDVLDRRESVALLREHRPDLPADDPHLHAIADDLGDLPLALDLAGRYLNKYRREIDPAAYLDEIRRPELLEHPSLRQAGVISPTRHVTDVWRTFALSFWRLDADNGTDEMSKKLLARAARLAPGEPIPIGLLAWTLRPPNGDDVPPQPTTMFRDALDKLTSLGLLKDLGSEALTMHRLVAAFALAEVPEDDAQVTVESACSLAARWAYRQGQPAILGALLPHLRVVTDSAKDRVDDMAAACCTALGMTLGEVGAFDEGLAYQERAWKITVERLGPENRYTLQRRSDMAGLLERKGDRARARAIYEEVLEAQERRLGREDLDVAATLNNLGASFVQDDLYHETLRCYLRALRIRESVWRRTEPNDPSRRENAYKVAESHGNMGKLLMDLGRHGEAGSHLTTALQILADEEELAHERNADNLVIVGRVLRAQRGYHEAVSTIGSALAIYMNIGRTYSADSARALANIGAAYKEWAEEDQTLSAPQRAWILDEASGSLHAALNGSEQMYGEDHPMTGGILGALAEVCDAQGHTEDGHRYRQRAGVNRRKNLEAACAGAAVTLSKYGTFLINRGLYDEALAYLERAMQIRENTSREPDFDTSTSLLKLGILHQLRGQAERASARYERALAIRRDVCGSDHPATQLVQENLRLLDA